MSTALAAHYRERAAHNAQLAETFALAILNGSNTPDVMAELRDHNRQADLYRDQAAHLTPTAWARPNAPPWTY